MLITNGGAMMGTVYDDINKMAMELKVGDCLTFGSFIPQTDSFALDIRFPMLWHVIDRKENKLKLLSYFFFEHTGYWTADAKARACWENTAIRRDLNDKYFHDCFTQQEKNAILTTEVRTKTNASGYSVTQDKLYVPSLEEIQNIPGHLKIGRALFAENDMNDAPVAELMYCFYWLRDPGEYDDSNLIVQGYTDSQLVLDSLNHYSDEVGVRAVMWVDAEKIV